MKKRSAHRTAPSEASPAETDEVFTPDELRRMAAAEEEYLSAPGLDIRGVVEVRLAFQEGQAKARRRDEPRTPEWPITVGPDGVVGEMPPRDIMLRMARSAMARGEVPLGRKSLLAYDLDPEKVVVRQALATLAAGNPRTLAEAMKVRVSTLYAFSDPGRRNRPGPDPLYRAALFFRLLAEDASQVSKNLAEIAATAIPVRRGRPPNSPANDVAGERATAKRARARKV